MGRYAGKQKRPLNEIAIIDQETIDLIAAQVPGGGVTLNEVKADTAIADSLTKRHSNSNDHVSGSDNQDLSNLVVKETGKSLIADSAITDLTDGGETTLHTHPGGGLTLETVKADTDIASAISLKHSNSNDHASGSDNQDLSGLEPKQTGKSLSANDLTTALKTSYDGAVTHAGAPHAPAGAQVNADITKAEIEAKLTGTISSHSHSGGSGDVVAPATNSADYLPQWNGINSKTLKDGLAVPAGGLAGLTALGNKADVGQTHYLGTTQVAINRGSGALALAGVSIDGTAANPTWMSGITTKNITDVSTVQNIAHGLGRVPKYVRIDGCVIISAAITQIITAIFDGTNNTGMNIAIGEGTSSAATDAVYTSTTIALGFSPLVATNPFTGANRQTGVVTVDATNIIITWTKTGTIAGTASLIWQAT